MFCFGYLWEKPWWETPRPILQTTAATWGVCIWDIYLYRYPHLGMVHRQLARMDNVFPFHHLPGFKKCEPLKSERFANWNMIIFNGSWLNSMGRCPPLRRPTQSSAKLVFVTSAAVEIHGNPRRFEWATNLHCHLWWPEGNSLFYPVSSYFHYHYCYYDSMPTIQWFDMICSGQMVGWCGVDVFFFKRDESDDWTLPLWVPHITFLGLGSQAEDHIQVALGAGKQPHLQMIHDLWWFTC